MPSTGWTASTEPRDALTGVPYDLILLDLMLPDGRGLDFLRAPPRARGQRRR